MAGGAYIVKRNADGTEAPRAIRGSLPTAGSGVAATGQRFGGKIGAAVTHDEQVERVLTRMYGVDLYQDPIRFAELNGLFITDPNSMQTVLESPDIVRSAIVDASKQISMARASQGRIRATTATGSDYRGRSAKFAIATHLLR